MAGRDDTDGFRSVMSNTPHIGHEQEAFGDFANHPPSHLSPLDPVLFVDGERIGECTAREQETDPVLAPVSEVLGWVPFEPTHL